MALFIIVFFLTPISMRNAFMIKFISHLVVCVLHVHSGCFKAICIIFTSQKEQKRKIRQKKDNENDKRKDEMMKTTDNERTRRSPSLLVFH